MTTKKFIQKIPKKKSLREDKTLRIITTDIRILKLRLAKRKIDLTHLYICTYLINFRNLKEGTKTVLRAQAKTHQKRIRSYPEIKKMKRKINSRSLKKIHLLTKAKMKARDPKCLFKNRKIHSLITLSVITLCRQLIDIKLLNQVLSKEKKCNQSTWSWEMTGRLMFCRIWGSWSMILRWLVSIVRRN